MNNLFSEPTERQWQLRLPSLPQLLRWVGVASLTAAFGAFLLQEWSDGNDVIRYTMLLGLTMTLTLGGIADSLWLREVKGARTFLALALGSIPVNFAVLGALLYSRFPLSGGPAQYPQAALWRVEQGSTILILVAIALPLLAVTARFAFSVHAREAAGPLTWLYLLGNLLILLPVRAPEAVSVLLFLLTLTLLFALSRLIQVRLIHKTFEGRIALAALFIPPLILATRTLWLYLPGPLFPLLAALSGHLTIRFANRLTPEDGRLHASLRLISVATAAYTALTLTQALHLGQETILPLFTISFGVLTHEIGLRRLAALTMASGLTLNMVLFDHTTHPLLAILVGFTMMAGGIRNREKALFLYGGLLMAIGLVGELYAALFDFRFDNWGTLALLGIGAVLAGSVLERYSDRLRQWRREVENWDY